MDELPPPEPDRLEYWHSNDAPPLHPVLLGLAFAGTALLSFVVVFAGGTFMAVLSLDKGFIRGSDKIAGVIVGVIAFLLAIFFTYKFVKMIRNGKSLSLGERRTAGRFAVAGLLFGAGIACLVQGACFSISAGMS